MGAAPALQARCAAGEKGLRKSCQCLQILETLFGTGRDLSLPKGSPEFLRRTDRLAVLP
jgi:hypothetical protein